MKKIKYLLLLLIFTSCSKSNITETDEEETIEEITELANEILNIQFPNNFVKDPMKFHIILSDSSGKSIDYKTYSNINNKLTFHTTEEFNESTPFILTFIFNYDNIIFDIHVYSNLSNISLENNISLKSRSYSKITKIVDIPTTKLDNDYIINAMGHGYSMVKINNTLSGHYTSEFNEDFGTKNIFMKYYNPNDEDSYNWALIEDPSSITELTEDIFSNENVTTKHLTTNVYSELPLLIMYGYENDQLFNNMFGHRIYDDYIRAFGFGGNHYYSFLDFFKKTSYSLSFSNYSLFGIGIPPDELNVFDNNISSTFLNNELTFSGEKDFEVGRIRLDNRDLRINMEFIFDGQLKEIIKPVIPEGILPENIKEAINKGNLRLVQAVAEDYESFENYNQYINNVLKNSIPFYISSPKRERVFKSYLPTDFLLPITEFPYQERFR